MQTWYVYIVSNRSHTIYVGITTDLRRRAREHRERKYLTSFTARYTFNRLVWFEQQESEAAAKIREQQIKRWPRARKVRVIQEMNPNWRDLAPSLADLLCLR